MAGAILRRGAGLLILISGAGGGGCLSTKPDAVPTRPELTIEERRAMQTREFDAPVDTVFASTIAVLQDLGWQLDNVDRPAGIIRATTARRPEVFGPEDEKSLDLRARKRTAEMRADVAKKWSRWRELVIHIEPWGSRRSRQRLVLSLRGSLPAMSYRERQEGSFMHRGREVLINAPATEQSVEVDVAEAYADMFDRISAAVGQRRSQP